MNDDHWMMIINDKDHDRGKWMMITEWLFMNDDHTWLPQLMMMNGDGNHASDHMWS